MKILITGKPGVGKSTIIKNLSEIRDIELYGVVALEVRGAWNERVGFKAVNLEGEEKLFSHVTDIKSEIIVGKKYYVDVSAIDTFVVDEIRKGLNDENSLVLIDEIGRMQSYSEEFMNTVRTYFTSNSNLLATIVYEDEPWSLEFKNNPESILIEINENNRDQINESLEHIFSNLKSYNHLNQDQKDKVDNWIREYFESGEYYLLKKLFKNALFYLLEGKLLNKEEIGDFINYKIEGSTNNHLVKFDRRSGEYICDCDLFHGKGKFESYSGMCSHIQLVELNKLNS